MPIKPSSVINFSIINQIQRGFTLVETIVGIVVLSVTFAIFTSFINPLSTQSAEQVHQIRAAELGQSMINEILGRAFDDNSDMSGGVQRCGEIGFDSCSTSIGPETGETRATFDDVDDYDTNGTKITPENALGGSIQDMYTGFTIKVDVIHDSNYDGVADNNFSTAKLITVTIFTPQKFGFTFSVYKVNF